MATYFKLKYSGAVIPIEEPQLTDSSQTVRSLHSNIDKIIGSGIEKAYGTTSTNIKYGTYTTTTSGVALSSASILNSIFTCNTLCVRIVSAASSGTPEVLISITGNVTANYLLGLEGVGDILLISALGDSQGIYTVSSSDIYIMSAGSATLANIEIVAGVKQ